MSKLRQLVLALFVICSLTAGASAQTTNLTQIRDTINNPDGTPFNGTVVITWVGFSTPTSGSVSPLSTSARIYNGALSVLLVPSTTAASGSHYSVVYYSDDATVTWSETWSVPVSTDPLSVSGVRTASTPGGGGSTGTGGTGTGGTGSAGTYATLPIAITSVTGLSDDLNSINTAVTALQTTVAGLSSGSGSSNTTLTQTVTALSATVSGLSTTVTGLTTTAAGLNTTVTSLGNTVNGLSTTTTGLSSTTSGLTTTVNGLSSTVSGLSGSVATNTNGLSALTNTVGSLNTTVGTLNTTINGLSTSTATNTSNIATLNTSVSNMSNTVTGLQASVSALQSGGNSGSTLAVSFIDGETPAGATNGTNTAFTLSQAPTPAGSLELYRNGLVQTGGTDYTVAGTNITFAAGNIPVTGDLLQAYYRVTGSSPLPVFADDEVPSGPVNGSNLTFVLAAAPMPQLSLKLYKNGMLMQQHADYTLSGTTITFVTVSGPQAGDSIVAYYRH